MTDFDKALKFVFDHECEYDKNGKVRSENVDGDAGGLTKYGIDQRSHPDVDIENLTVEKAAEIYRKEYWEKHHCDKLDWPLSLAIFDIAVNMGGGMAIKLLQRVCQTVDDGAWGKNTQAAVTAACKVRGPETVALQVCVLRDQFYNNLAESKPHLAKFKNGWLNRVEDLRKEIV
jgi:lysozyme family protein